MYVKSQPVSVELPLKSTNALRAYEHRCLVHIVLCIVMVQTGSKAQRHFHVRALLSLLKDWVLSLIESIHHFLTFSVHSFASSPHFRTHFSSTLWATFRVPHSVSHHLNQQRSVLTSTKFTTRTFSLHLRFHHVVYQVWHLAAPLKVP